MVADESHHLKNSKTKTYLAMKALSMETLGTLLLTGTPVANTPIDFFAQLSLVNRQIRLTRYQFGQRFCSPRQVQIPVKFLSDIIVSCVCLICRESTLRSGGMEARPTQPSSRNIYHPLSSNGLVTMLHWTYHH